MSDPLDLGAVRAVLADLDGTLIDSTPATLRVYAGWMADRGIEAPGDHPHGVPARQVVAMVAPHLDPAEEAAELERREVADVDGVRALSGAEELLAADAPWGLEVAIVTSCTAPLADARLGAAGLVPPSVVVTADRTERVKPDPDPFLLAAELLGLEPADCLVVEDAPAGIAAGRAAGMQVVALRTTHADHALVDAHLIVNDLAALTAMLPVRLGLDAAPMEAPADAPRAP
ncbi:MAG: HAD-IA family hydrolase [Solirubrobacteraceae bacterium]|nr:HAD-IA family hydrolase [Solirubrobacteraceae bacterium]